MSRLFGPSAPAVVAGFVACTVLLTLGDQFHVQFGAIRYPLGGPVFGQAWWVGPGFALAILGFVAVAWRPAAWIVKPTERSLALDAGWFFGSYAASGILGASVVLTTVLLPALYLQGAPFALSFTRWLRGG